MKSKVFEASDFKKRVFRKKCEWIDATLGLRPTRVEGAWTGMPLRGFQQVVSALIRIARVLNSVYYPA